jgi:hypothetical protein
METYRTFDNIKFAGRLIKILENNDIPFEIENNSSSADTLSMSGIQKTEIKVKIDKEHFEKVNAIDGIGPDDSIMNFDDDHYLYDYTTDELFDILCVPKEWSDFDKNLAKEILNERGEDTSDSAIENLKQKKIEERSKPDPAGKTWAFAGYLLTFGPLIALIITIAGLLKETGAPIFAGISSLGVFSG